MSVVYCDGFTVVWRSRDRVYPCTFARRPFCFQYAADNVHAGLASARLSVIGVEASEKKKKTVEIWKSVRGRDSESLGRKDKILPVTLSQTPAVFRSPAFSIVSTALEPGTGYVGHVGVPSQSCLS